MEHAEKACAEITWDGRRFQSDAFERGPRTLRRDMRVEGDARGAVTVSYVEPCPPSDAVAFPAEEADLVEAVAYMLSVALSGAWPRNPSAKRSRSS